MKKTFKNYFIDENEIINDGIIILDTNILINLYKVTVETRNKILEIIKTHKDRVYMPYWIGKEFMEVRRYVINELILSAENCINEIDISIKTPKFEKNLIFYDPVFQEENSKYLKEEIKKFKDDIKKELIKRIEEKNPYTKENSLYEDSYLDELFFIYENKIGKPYPKEELEKIIKDGKIRYSEKMPPGYKDDKKEENIKKYGDFIIWKEILTYAKEEKENIIFVTNDEKEDWYEQLPTTLDPQKKEKKAGKGNQSLINEFVEETGKNILIMNLENFINKIGKIAKNDNIGKELEALKEKEKEVIYDGLNILELINQMFTDEKQKKLKNRIETYSMHSA
ncbi:MAG: PIN domain-containing protein [Fusobacterium ulcerans]|uniref:PIN domain-containing protein n=1 Tax=Fusobacterium ulcerans TaxID=861 RepID=UPI003A861C01